MLRKAAGDGPRLCLTYAYACRRRTWAFFSENTNECAFEGCHPDATCEEVAAAQRCAFISISIFGVLDVIGRAFYHIWLAFGGILIVHVALHLVANADNSYGEQRGAYALQN